MDKPDERQILGHALWALAGMAQMMRNLKSLGWPVVEEPGSMLFMAEQVASVKAQESENA